MRDVQAQVAPKPPQGILVRGHAGLVIHKLSENAVKIQRRKPEGRTRRVFDNVRPSHKQPEGW